MFFLSNLVCFVSSSTVNSVPSTIFVLFIFKFKYSKISIFHVQFYKFWKMHNRVSTTTIKIQNSSTTPINPLLSSLCSQPFPTMLTTGSNQSVFPSYGFVFSSMSYKCSHTVCSLLNLSFYLAQCICDSHMFLYISIIHYFLLLRSILLYGCTTVCPFTSWRMFGLFPVWEESWLWIKLL